VVQIEDAGTPAVLLVMKRFDVDSRRNARSLGMDTIRLICLDESAVPLPELLKISDMPSRIATGIMNGLTTDPQKELTDTDHDVEYITYRGIKGQDASTRMEKDFLNRCWSDGLPLVPPTKEAVVQMTAAVERDPEESIGTVMPGGTQATIRKIAVNAVMAGCLPQYMPVLVAAVEAITDPRFDLLGVQCTAGMVSPLLIISGGSVIDDLNINDSFGSLGPGWRANSTIGRALRLVMINIGLAWPGNPDMKAIGSPFKNVPLIAENERIYNGFWEPFRVSEGFDYDQPTISAYPAVGWQPEVIPPDKATTEELITLLGAQVRVKYDKKANFWGMDNLVILSPNVYETIRREKHSRKDFQKMLYDVSYVPCREFFAGDTPLTDFGGVPIPDTIVNTCKEDPNASAPLLCAPENIKIIATGAPGPLMFAFVSTWGFGNAYCVHKPIQLPERWKDILAENDGWQTPIIR